MPVLSHTNPCAACPFRKESLPGYLGASTPTEFMLHTLDQEVRMPCHSAIDYEDKDWYRSQYPQAPLCAGALAFMCNTAKSPRDPDLRDARNQVGRRDDVFGNRKEFLEHHQL